MVTKIGYRLPFVLMLVFGVLFVVQYFVPHPAIKSTTDGIQQIKQPVSAFIIFIGLVGLLVMHARRVKNRERRWGYSLVTLTSAAAMAVVGMVWGVDQGTVYADWFTYLLSPIEATMFSLLAFFVASAAFRAFRARTAGATILLVSAFIVMFGMIPFFEELFPPLSKLASFIVSYPNTAAKRAILIGTSLGAMSVAIKTIFGIDRTILGREQ